MYRITLPENQLSFKFHHERASQKLKQITKKTQINKHKKPTKKAFFFRSRWLRQSMSLKKETKNHLAHEIYGTIKLQFINWHPELQMRNNCKQHTSRAVSLNQMFFEKVGLLKTTLIYKKHIRGTPCFNYTSQVVPHLFPILSFGKQIEESEIKERRALNTGEGIQSRQQNQQKSFCNFFLSF